MSRSGITSGWPKKAEWVVRNAEALGRPSKGPSNVFEPVGDRPSNLVGTVLLHEVETSDDDAVLIREAARCGGGSGGARCLSLADYVMETGATRGATVAEGC